jgi:GxxExxY protein
VLEKKGVFTENELSHIVIGIAIGIHQEKSPGLLESAYKELLFYKLVQSGYHVEKEKSMPLECEGVKIGVAYRIDLLVEHKLVIEIKAVKELTDIDLARTLTCLRLGNFRLGLLMNFNVVRLKDGIKRVVNGL